jgi:hypothetical protein
LTPYNAKCKSPATNTNEEKDKKRKRDKEKSSKSGTVVCLFVCLFVRSFVLFVLFMEKEEGMGNLCTDATESNKMMVEYDAKDSKKSLKTSSSKSPSVGVNSVQISPNQVSTLEGHTAEVCLSFLRFFLNSLTALTR